MLIFYQGFGNLGQGAAGNWYVGPLILFLPFLLGSGLLQLPFQLLSLLLGGGGSITYVYTPSTGWQREEASLGTAWPLLLLLSALLVALVVLLVRRVRRHGLLAALRPLFTGFGGRFGGGEAGQQRVRARTQPERMARVSELVQALPIEVYHSREELEAMPVAELKELLRKAGVKCQGAPLEKRELVDCLQAGANSSSTTCSICCDDYASGDVLRALKCGHRFHLECLDRWLLSSTDYSRPPACPMCNREL